MTARIAAPFSDSRARKLYEELAFALLRTNSATLKAWGSRSAGQLVKLTGRRVSVLSSLVVRLGKGSASELRDMFSAWREGMGSTHFGDRASAAIDSSIAIARGSAKVVGGIGSALMDNPRTNAPKVVAAFLGFYAGSGGVDGNGGIPDLDLLAGIDAHRSILTHSIIAGIVAEGVLLAAADLAAQVYDKLPADHDPLWDKLAKAASPLTEALAAGTSAGIAYHLLVDAGIQPAPYHGLPFEMPMAGHQAFMTANGLAEGADVAKRSKPHSSAEIIQSGLMGKSTGRKVVDAVANVATQSAEYLRDFWRGSMPSLKTTPRER